MSKDILDLGQKNEAQNQRARSENTKSILPKIEILHEEKHFAAVIKPAGIISQAASGADENSKRSMVSLLSAGLSSPIYPVHRLDREAFGVMIYAKTKAGAEKISRLITDGSFEKQYLTVVESVPEPERGEMVDLLLHDSKKNKSYVVDRERKGVRKAILEYEVLGKAQYAGRTLSLTRVLLHTGRTHQIRVQFASRKMPIVGDSRYGSSIKAQMCLCSHQISFINPFSGKNVSFQKVPDGEFFKLFGLDVL